MMKARMRIKYRFSWRRENRFELLIDGERFFPRMLKAIDEARQYIWLEMYFFESGEVANTFINALIHATERGVSVKLLLDDFGARGLSHYDRRRLEDSHVAPIFYNPLHRTKLFDNLARDHRKLLLIDGEIAFVGGAGITDEFNPPTHPENRWRETMICIQGPVLADWQSLFREVWKRHAQELLPFSSMPALVRNDGMLGRVTVASGLIAQGVMRSLLRHTHAAEHQVWVSTAYFVPSRRFRRALRRAVRRGVDVRLLLPGPYTDHPAVRQAGRRYYAALLRFGIRIFEYQPRVLHTKAALCDQWVSIGSSNFDRWNLRWNLEANQTVDDQVFAAQVRDMFAADFKESAEIRYENWQRRPGYMRLWEWFWGRADLWLHRLGKGRRRDTD